MRRPGTGFGFRSSNSFVHPDARNLALECVSTRKEGGACHRRATPPSLRPRARGELRRWRGRQGVGQGGQSRRLRCGVPVSGPARGAWCHLVEALTRRVRSKRRRDRGAELVEAVAPLWAAPEDGRGLASARPTRGSPLVDRPTWERDHGQAGRSSRRPRGRSQRGIEGADPSRSRTRSRVSGIARTQQGASRRRQAVKAGRARRRFSSGRWRGRLMDGTGRSRGACEAARRRPAYRAGDRGRAHPNSCPPLSPRLDRSRSTARRSRAIRAPE